jgi:hypothetical protein
VGNFILFPQQVGKFLLVDLNVLLEVFVHLAQFVALLNELGILRQNAIDVFLTHLFVVHRDVLYHLQLLLHPPRLALQLLVDLFCGVLLFGGIALIQSCLALALVDQLLQAAACSLGIIVRVGDGSDLGLEVLELVVIGVDLTLGQFDFAFEACDFDVELLELQGLLLVFLALPDEFVEHVLQIAFAATDFLDHLRLLLLQALDLAVQHVSEVLECGLLIPRILACIFLALDDLQPFEQLMLHLQDFFITLEVLESNVVVLLEQLLEHLLLLFVLPLQTSVFLSQAVIPRLQLFIYGLHLYDLLLLAADLLLNLALVVFFLAG